LAESRGDPLFDKYPNPMPLTIGEFHAGNWPASAPGEAAVAGVLGFLPNKTAQEVMAEMTEALGLAAEPDGGRHVDVQFTYRHDASVVRTDHPLVTSLEEAVRSCEREPQVDAMTASCDAWFYNNQLGIPTVVFGGGSLGVAHSTNEHMPVSELAAAAEILVRLAMEWCA
jgi:acetylornithine deacetylase/succinyl-diaminopimelate desuccinylase-like protein